MAKTRVVKNFRPVSTFTDAPPPLLEFEEGGSQTFLLGDPVKFSGGRIVVHGGGSEDEILGFAAGPAHNSTAGDDKILIWPALPTVIYEGTLVATVSTDHVLLITNIGVNYGLVKYTPDTPDVWAIDVAEVTDPLFKIIGIGSGDDGDASSALGDTNARVKFVIDSSRCELMSYPTVP